MSFDTWLGLLRVIILGVLPYGAVRGNDFGGLDAIAAVVLGTGDSFSVIPRAQEASGSALL